MVKISKAHKNNNKLRLHNNEFGIIHYRVNSIKEKLTILYRLGKSKKTAVIDFKECMNVLIEENFILDTSTTKLFIREDRTSPASPIERLEYTPKEFFSYKIVSQVPKWTNGKVEMAYRVYDLGEEMVTFVLEDYLKKKHPKRRLKLNQEVLDTIKNNEAVVRNASKNKRQAAVAA